MSESVANEEYRLLGKSTNSNHLNGRYEHLDGAKMKKAFSKLDSEPKHVMMMGWEWETSMYKKFCCEKVIKNIANSEMGDHVFFYQDSGLEMPSIPASLGYHKEMLEKYFFGNDFHKAFFSNKTDSMHVHVDKKNFNAISIKKYITFINLPENRQFIEAIGGRSLSTYNRPNPFEILRFKKDNKVKGTNLKFKDMKQRKALQVSTSRKNKYNKQLEYPIQGRGCAVSTSSTKRGGKFTVESRFMLSTPIMALMFARLEFIEASIIFSRNSVYKDLYAPQFCQFVKKNEERYPYLYEHAVVQNMLMVNSDTFFRERIAAVKRQKMLSRSA